MILINKCFSECTPESAENGETSDCGMALENGEYSFKELIAELQNYPEPSSSHGLAQVGTWFSTGFRIDDYATGTECEESLHYSQDNHARSAKYWVKAIRYVYGEK